MVSTEQLLSLINGLGGILWEADPHTFRFSFVSEGAERILGYPVSDWLAEPDFWQRHTHPDDVDRCIGLCLDASREGRDQQFEYRMLAADGRIVWLRDIVSVRGSCDGSTRLVGLALDITADKDAEAEKQQAHDLYEALIANSSDNIGLIRADGTCVYQSAALSRQLGYAPDDVVGRNNFALVHPEDLPAVNEAYRSVLRTEDAVGPVRYRFRHREGRWCTLETMAKRFTGSAGDVFIVTNTRDVSEMVEAQRALESTQHQLAHAMKMEAVGRLAGGIAHDFNNLLTVIGGYADLLAATFETGDERAADVGEIRRAAQRASLLTRQLLAFSRKQVLRPEVLDLNIVVHEVAVLIRRLIGEDVQLSIETEPAPLPVRADRSQLEQVLMNLSINARDAMPLGGRLSIRTAEVDGQARLAVADTGTGMPPEVLARIFEPFFTTKELGKGTGLGLPTVYGIVQQSGGQVHVNSEVGRGTEFAVTLPIVASPDEAKADTADGTPRGSETILFVEDEDQVRSLLGQVLSQLGYTVLTARDGSEALELASRHRRDLALLVTDVVMVHSSGPELYARVSAVVPSVRVLYISGYTGDPMFARGVREEGVAFLQKPFPPLALAQKVREVLDDRSPGETEG